MIRITLLVGLLACLPGGVRAASPVDDYLAARGRHETEINRIVDRGGDAAAAETRALRDLEGRLRVLVGPLDVTGFPAQGTVALEGLTRSDQGFGLLDGLTARSADGRTRLVVTTRALLLPWLKAHANWWPGLANVPQALRPALASEAFHTQAMSQGAAAVGFGAIPVTVADPNEAVALLAAHRQDVGREMPDELIVSVIRGERVLIANHRLARKLPVVPRCEAIWTRARTRMDAATVRSRPGSAEAQTAFDAVAAIETKADEAFRACVGEAVRTDAAFAGLAREAQALADRLLGVAR